MKTMQSQLAKKVDVAVLDASVAKLTTQLNTKADKVVLDKLVADVASLNKDLEAAEAALRVETDERTAGATKLRTDFTSLQERLQTIEKAWRGILFKQFQVPNFLGFRHFIKVSTTTSCPHGNYFAWTNVEHNSSLFFRQSNNNRIDFNMGGSFLVVGRVSGASNASGHYASIYLSGSDIIRCRDSCPHSYTHNYGFSQVIQASPGDYLQVYWSSNTGSSSDVNSTKLCVIALDHFGIHSS